MFKDSVEHEGVSWSHWWQAKAFALLRRLARWLVVLFIEFGVVVAAWLRKLSVGKNLEAARLTWKQTSFRWFISRNSNNFIFSGAAVRLHCSDIEQPFCSQFRLVRPVSFVTSLLRWCAPRYGIPVSGSDGSSFSCCFMVYQLSQTTVKHVVNGATVDEWPNHSTWDHVLLNVFDTWRRAAADETVI